MREFTQSLRCFPQPVDPRSPVTGGQPDCFQRTVHGLNCRWQCTCVACWKGIREEEVGAEEFDEVLAAWVAGGGEAGEDFPGSLAAFGLVSTGELSGDDCGAQSAFGVRLWRMGRCDAGLIDELPVESESADWVISNCVINLSPEKDRVFAEIARMLRPGVSRRVHRWSDQRA